MQSSISTSPKSHTDLYHTIQAALNNWKAARALLATTIQSCRVACAALHNVSTLPANQFEERLALEELMSTANSELASLKEGENRLYSMRQLLATTRNKSMTLTPINTLPPEILAAIFALSKTYCIHDDKGSFQNFAEVCTYWRHIAFHTADLWTHVDIGRGVPEDLATARLERTKNMPIYLRAFEPKSVDSPTANIIITTLRPHVHRIHTLDVVSLDSTGVFIIAVLDLWLTSGNPKLTRSLLIFPNGKTSLQLDTHRQRMVATLVNQSENAQSVLQNLNILRLPDVIFGWNSGVYRSLIDLRLISRRIISISVSRLADLLAANPMLSILKLKWVEVNSTRRRSYPAPIVLSHLKVLTLLSMDRNCVRHLLSLIDIPDSHTELGIGFGYCGDLISGLGRFVVVSRATAMYYSDHTRKMSPHWPSLLQSMPRLRSLILDEADIADPLPESNTVIPHQQSPSHVPSITLQQITATLEGLKQFINLFGVQNLRLERCSRPVTKLGWKFDDLEEPLLEVYPGLKLTVVNTFSTPEWSYSDNI
ncbi:hypothetical protein FRC12_014730 [Ceratobasidium sp. 428]|nr:hypothetical protein FRC12_014730 [Ceratobasidium sp. 428]